LAPASAGWLIIGPALRIEAIATTPSVDVRRCMCASPLRLDRDWFRLVGRATAEKGSARFCRQRQDAFGAAGVACSGICRDGGDCSFDFYMETKNVAVATIPIGYRESEHNILPIR
jgi:hypothetical protein